MGCSFKVYCLTLKQFQHETFSLHSSFLEIFYYFITKRDQNIYTFEKKLELSRVPSPIKTFYIFQSNLKPNKSFNRILLIILQKLNKDRKKEIKHHNYISI